MWLYEEDIIDKLKAEINRKVEEVLERPKRFLRNLKEIIIKLKKVFKAPNAVQVCREEQLIISSY